MTVTRRLYHRSAASRRSRSMMIFASEVPVISAMNPYRRIEDVFMTAWKRTNPKQVAVLQEELQVVVRTPEERVLAIVDELGATDAIQGLLQEAADAETTTRVAEAARKIEAALPSSTPPVLKDEVVVGIASEMNRSFGVQQESPAILKYEQEHKVSVKERNLVFFKKKVATVGSYELFVGGKIDGRADGKVIEVKNRLNRFMSPLPLYDVAQLQTYLFILGATEGELVEHLRGDQSETKLTPVPWNPHMWDSQISPLVVRFGSALTHFMKDPRAQIEFLKGAAEAQKEIIRAHWLMELDTL